MPPPQKRYVSPVLSGLVLASGTVIAIVFYFMHQAIAVGEYITVMPSSSAQTTESVENR